MNIFKKINKKKKEMEVEFHNTTNNNFETLILYTNSNNLKLKNEDVILTGLIILFNKTLINNYLELINNNSIDSICREDNNIYYIYIYGNLNEYKNTIKSLNPNNIFFKAILELCKGFKLIHMKEFIEDGLINGKDLYSKEFTGYGDYFIQQQYSSIPNKIFTMYDLSKIMRIKFENKENTIYNFIQYYFENKDCVSENTETTFYNIKSLFNKDEFEKLFLTPVYKRENIIESYQDEIFEPLETIDEVLEIKEDENGNLIYDKNQFL